MTDFDQWVGRSREVQSCISTELEHQFRVTLDGHLWDGGSLPLGLHWCLAPEIEPADRLGADGHAARTSAHDSFMPPIPLPTRMWAGGSLRYLKPLEQGRAITRRSEIRSISRKQGSSGELYLVEVKHDYSSEGQLHLEETQTLVYKAARKPGEGPDYAPGTGGVNSVTMFRYSAMTFNGHRIHYDADYARQEEHYPACVVHGPLQATLLLNHVAKQLGRMPTTFSYRGKAPLFTDEPWKIEEEKIEDGKGDLRFVGPQGRITTSAHYT